MKHTNWTREETIIAFNVYCKIPFKDSSARNPEVIKHAKIIGRSPSALNMKIGNFGRLDPVLKKRGISGLPHGSKMESDVWAEFHGNWEKLIYESELLIAKFAGEHVEAALDIDAASLPQGQERERVVRERVNQGFFRRAILSSYNQQCCITGLEMPDLLIASHIIPWAKNKPERLNPQNGLCLNALHDKAFDRGLITISTGYQVMLSGAIRHLDASETVKDFFAKFDGKPIFVPEKFAPKKEFLEYHHKEIFKK
ncbi:MAG: HNH endonuclease [Gammaproteobacteria bacterium]